MMFLTPKYVARRAPVHRALAMTIVLSVALLLQGCQPSIEVIPPAAPLPIATVAPEEHSVAIVGVEFDPPLDAAQILSSGGVTLLVALENRGLVTESSLRVSARLFDPGDQGRSTELLNESLTVRSLTPGELRVVRFTQVSQLPARSHYKLVIEAATAPGERIHEDNVRTFDIIVRDSD